MLESISVDIFPKKIDELLRDGKYKEALQQCKDLLKNIPQYIPGYLVLAKCHIYLRNWEEAIQEYEKILSQNSVCLGAMHGLYRIFKIQNKYDEQMKMGMSIIQIDPSNLTIQNELTSLKNKVKVGVDDLLEDRYSHEEIVTPTLAEIYLKQNLLQEAYTVYSKLLKKKPGDNQIIKKMNHIKHLLS